MKTYTVTTQSPLSHHSVTTESTTQVGRTPWSARDAFVPLPEAEGAATDSPAFDRLLERAMDVLAPNMARIGGMAVRNL